MTHEGTGGWSYRNTSRILSDTGTSQRGRRLCCEYCIEYPFRDEQTRRTTQAGHIFPCWSCNGAECSFRLSFLLIFVVFNMISPTPSLHAEAFRDDGEPWRFGFPFHVWEDTLKGTGNQAMSCERDYWQFYCQFERLFDEPEGRWRKPQANCRQERDL